MNLFQIKNVLRNFSLSQLRKLDQWLHELIRKAEEAEHAEHSQARKKMVVKRALDNRTYRLEGIRCGKENCKCLQGKPHGPYWYSYTRVKDKVTSQYIGKSLPKDIEKKMRNRNKV